MLIGNAARLWFKVRTFDRVLTDATVTLFVDQEGTAPVALVPVRLSAGSYECVFKPETAGRYVVRWAATGAVEVAKEHQLDVRPSRLA